MRPPWTISACCRATCVACGVATALGAGGRSPERNDPRLVRVRPKRALRRLSRSSYLEQPRRTLRVFLCPQPARSTWEQSARTIARSGLRVKHMLRSRFRFFDGAPGPSLQKKHGNLYRPVTPLKIAEVQSCALAAALLLRWRRAGLRSMTAAAAGRDSRRWARSLLVRLVNRKTL